jgi:hypothetical protein
MTNPSKYHEAGGEKTFGINMCGREEDVKIGIKGIRCEDLGWSHLVLDSIL